MGTDENIGIAALHLWARKGYQAVGIQEICLESRVTKPTLYHWYGSKLGLLKRILSGGFGPLCRDLKELGTYKGDVKTALSGWMEAWMRCAVDQPQFMRLQLSLSTAPPDSEEFQAAMEGQSWVFNTLTELFSAASQDHGNMKGRETAYALSFFGMMQSHGAALINGQTIWSDQKAREILHYFMHGIFS